MSCKFASCPGLREERFINRRHRRRQAHPSEQRAPFADGHGRCRPRFLGRSISHQHRSFQRGHRLHSPGHQRRAAAAQHGQVGRVFAAKVVRETGAGGRPPQRQGQLLLISGRRRTRSKGEERYAFE